MQERSISKFSNSKEQKKRKEKKRKSSCIKE
jgi:hypothetical protein